MSDQWFYARDGLGQTGPVPFAKLFEMARAGQVAPGDLVWRDGMAQWAAAETVPGLFERPAPPPPPPAPTVPFQQAEIPHAPTQPLPYANLQAYPAHSQDYGRALGYADEARTAMILAIVSVFCIGIVLGPIALVQGYGARRKMRASGNFDGDGMAIAAITIGWIVCGLHVLIILSVVVIMLVAAATH